MHKISNLFSRKKKIQTTLKTAIHLDTKIKRAG